MCVCRPGEPIPEEFKEWSTTVFVASTVGFLFGGMIGARWSGDKYIMMNHFTKYAHPMQAHVRHVNMFNFWSKLLKLGGGGGGGVVG